MEEVYTFLVYYKKILDGEKQKFGEAMQNQVNKNVAGKKEEVEKLKVQIELYENQIKKLEGLVEEHQKTINTADEKISSATEKINQAKEKFEFAHQSVMNQIEKDIDGIHENL